MATTQELAIAARRNLIGALGGPNITPEGETRVSQILGSASAAQIGQMAAGKNIDIFLGRAPRQVGGRLAFPTVADFNQAGIASSALPKEIEDIKAESARRLEETRAGIEAQFGEAIARQREIGAAEIGGTRARLATLRGVGASSSRLQFIKDQQKENARMIKELKTAESQALLNARTAAADEEEERIQQLRDNQFRLHQQAFNEAQAILAEGRAERGLELQERGFELQQEQFALQSEQVIAGLTGTFRGAPTFAAENAALQNMISIAGLTGEFMGAPTVAEKQRIANQAFQQAQITGIFEGQPTLAALSLGEAIRHNQAQEALQAQANAISSARTALDKKQVVTDANGNLAIINLTDESVTTLTDAEGNPVGVAQDLSNIEQFKSDMNDGIEAMNQGLITPNEAANRLIQAHPDKADVIQRSFMSIIVDEIKNENISANAGFDFLIEIAPDNIDEVQKFFEVRLPAAAASGFFQNLFTPGKRARVKDLTGKRERIVK